MDLRFYRDPDTGEPHLYKHGVSEDEVEDIIDHAIEDRAGAEGSRIAIGVTRGGRYLRVVYVPDRTRDSAFVVTAYELGPKAKRALRRRRRKKGS